MSDRMRQISEEFQNERHAPVGGDWGDYIGTQKRWLNYEEVRLLLGRKTKMAVYKMKQDGKITAYYPFDNVPMFNREEIVKLKAPKEIPKPARRAKKKKKPRKELVARGEIESPTLGL